MANGAVVGGGESEAKRICAECPVILECRDYSLQSQEPFGVWGGLTEDERDRVLGRMNYRRAR